MFLFYQVLLIVIIIVDRSLFLVCITCRTGQTVLLMIARGVPRRGVWTPVSMRVWACKESRAKHDQTSCCFWPPFLGTPLVPSRLSDKFFGQVWISIKNTKNVELVQTTCLQLGYCGACPNNRLTTCLQVGSMFMRICPAPVLTVYLRRGFVHHFWRTHVLDK